MQPYELDIALLTMKASNRPSQEFTLAEPILTMLRSLVNRSAQVVPGQPNLSPVVVLDTPAAAATFLGLISSPTNGHKLLISPLMKRLVVAIINRTARDLNGKIIGSN